MKFTLFNWKTVLTLYSDLQKIENLFLPNIPQKNETN